MPKKSFNIGISMDYDFKFGYFLKPGFKTSIVDRGAHLRPLVYDRHQIKKIIKDIDGLIIPGGIYDVDPRLYGEKIRHKAVKVLKERANFEFELLNSFLETKKPLLCICWGLQLLNVYLGGSLYQHLPADLKESKIAHEQEEEGSIATHRVCLEKRASKIFKKKSLMVNSTHHQGIKKLASSLVDQGRADDGIIEICTIKKHPFAWAVQWHPERLKNDPVIPAFLDHI